MYSQESGSSKAHIVRIPLIGPTLANYEGYLTNFNSLTTLLYEVGNNFIDTIQGVSENIVDMMPADFVVNYMLVIAVNEEPVELISDDQEEKGHRYLGIKMNIKLHNLSSSSRNPIKLGTLSQYIVEGWTEYSDHRVRLNIHEKKWQRKLHNLRRNVPKEVKNRLAHLLDMKSWKIESQQESITLGKKKELVRKYKYFFEREWICESNKSIDYFNYLSH